MNAFTIALLISLVVFASAMSISNETDDSVQKSSECSDFSLSDGKTTVEGKTCVVSGTLKVRRNEICYISKYDKTTVTPPLKTTPASNGIAQCTQTKCDGSSEPTVIDCKEAFGAKLSEFEN